MEQATSAAGHVADEPLRRMAIFFSQTRGFLMSEHQVRSSCEKKIAIAAQWLVGSMTGGDVACSIFLLPPRVPAARTFSYVVRVRIPGSLRD